MADEKSLIVGTWKLVSVMYEDQETKALTPLFGDNPRGFQIATPDGRWLVFTAAGGDEGNVDILAIPAVDGQKPIVLVGGSSRELEGSWRPR